MTLEKKGDDWLCNVSKGNDLLDDLEFESISRSLKMQCYSTVYSIAVLIPSCVKAVELHSQRQYFIFFDCHDQKRFLLIILIYILVYWYFFVSKISYRTSIQIRCFGHLPE